MKRIAALLSEAMPPDQAMAYAERIMALTDEPIVTEEELNRTMATVASSSRRIAATMRTTLKVLAFRDPRRRGLNEAALGLVGVAGELERALERAGVELAA